MGATPPSNEGENLNMLATFAWYATATLVLLTWVVFTLLTGEGVSPPALAVAMVFIVWWPIFWRRRGE